MTILKEIFGIIHAILEKPFLILKIFHNNLEDRLKKETNSSFI